MRRSLLILLAVCLAFSVLTSCGPKEEVKAEETENEVVFVRNNAAEPQSLDPAAIQGIPEHNIYMCLFEGLVTYNPETLGPEPGVAESWECSEDGKTWTFHLRENAVFSDGVPITAQTFVDSWLRFMAPETASQYAYLPGMVIEGAWDYNKGEVGPEAVAIRALDDHTFQFDLVGPTPYVLSMLGHYAFGCVPMHAIEKYGSEWIHPENFVGNGAFTLKEWIPQDKMVFVKSETYWDKANVQLDKVIFYPIDDENTSLNMYLQGDIDWIEDVPAARLEEMQLDDTYNCFPTLITYYYVMNQTRPPFDDVRVRKALAMAFDRQLLVDRITRAGEFPAYTLTPDMAGYPADKLFEEDYEEARRLLAEAGYPNGEGFPKSTVIYNTLERHKKIAEYIQQQWAENLGIEIAIENQEWNTYIDNKNNQNFDLGRAGWVGDYPDPNTFLQDLLHSEAGNNDGKYNNPEFDALLEKAALMPGGPERFEVMKQAEKIAIGDDMAVIPFYHYTRTNWIDTEKWGGWYCNVQDMHPLKFVYKK